MLDRRAALVAAQFNSSSTGSKQGIPMPEPVVFVSYSHDSEAHKAWVLKLATDLRSNGVDAILDVWDLTELTRAANLVCTAIRTRLDPPFRLQQGHITVRFGMDINLRETRVRPLYRKEELVGKLYAGLRAFSVVRAQRDIHVGAGELP